MELLRFHRHFLLLVQRTSVHLLSMGSGGITPPRTKKLVQNRKKILSGNFYIALIPTLKLFETRLQLLVFKHDPISSLVTGVPNHLIHP